MKKHIWTSTTCAVVFACGTMVTNAQEDNSETATQPDQQQMMQEDSGMPGMRGRSPGYHHGRGRGAMRSGMMGPGMMGGGMMGHGMMRTMLIIMDTDDDGALSLAEVQAVHQRMFNAADADDDGRLTLEEIEQFMRGMRAATAPE
jgi:hypothetical protein